MVVLGSLRLLLFGVHTKLLQIALVDCLLLQVDIALMMELLMDYKLIQSTIQSRQINTCWYLGVFTLVLSILLAESTKLLQVKIGNLS